MSARDWPNPVFRHCDGSGNRSLRDLLRQMERGELIVPAYQRGRVWTEAQKSAWVGHVLSGGPCPAIFLRYVNAPGGSWRDEIVDGQQRLTACLEWLGGDLPARLLWCGLDVHCDGDEARAALYRRSFPVVSMPTATTDEEAMRMYLALNSGGTPHTAEDLDRVRALLPEVSL